LEIIIKEKIYLTIEEFYNSEYFKQCNFDKPFEYFYQWKWCIYNILRSKDFKHLKDTKSIGFDSRSGYRKTKTVACITDVEEFVMLINQRNYKSPSNYKKVEVKKYKLRLDNKAYINCYNLHGNCKECSFYYYETAKALRRANPDLKYGCYMYEEIKDLDHKFGEMQPMASREVYNAMRTIWQNPDLRDLKPRRNML